MQLALQDLQQAGAFTVGSACSGTDVIFVATKVFLTFVTDMLGLPRIVMEHEFVCEKDPAKQRFSGRSDSNTQRSK